MRVLILTILLAAAASCGSDGSTSPASTSKTVEVTTSGETFLPTIVNIAPGDSVRWTFSTAADGHGHNVLFEPRITGAPPNITAEYFSGSKTLAFPTAGDFTYVCALHGGMTGEVVVK